MALNYKRKKFAELIAKGLDKTKAAIEVGYSKSSAYRTANKLLKDPEVKEHIDISRGTLNAVLQDNGDVVVRSKHHIEADNFDDMVIDYTRLLKELNAIAVFDPATLFDDNKKILHVTNMPKLTRHAISEIDVKTNRDGETITKLKFHNKVSAINNLLDRLLPPKEDHGDGLSEKERFEQISILYQKMIERHAGK
jgi:phage terminase small subunit